MNVRVSISISISVNSPREIPASHQQKALLEHAVIPSVTYVLVGGGSGFVGQHFCVQRGGVRCHALVKPLFLRVFF